ncbi:hypothetical protein PHYPO_G00103150 [Pangasianodon hypophthalmus]|uniref:Uncharacterized protein n=1 Tax=Pangasianodon hypophthalmus TaxID=310915 RepID=A0A5N5PYX6_PANHP|nr:hypothetical protein PHYPO_G00103150 [Pangasianodon hypophthalmus]
MIKQSAWASKAPPRRSPKPRPLQQRGCARSTGASLTKPGSLTRLRYGPPPSLHCGRAAVSHDSVNGEWTKWKVLGARERFSTTSAGQRNSFFFAFSSLFFLDSIPRWGISF